MDLPVVSERSGWTTTLDAAVTVPTTVASVGTQRGKAYEDDREPVKDKREQRDRARSIA